MPRWARIYWGFALAAGFVVGALIGVWLLAGDPEAADCAALLKQSEHTSDVGTQLAEAGCTLPADSDPTAQP